MTFDLLLRTKSAKVIFFNIFKCSVNLRDTNNHHTFDYILASSELLIESWTLYWNLLKPMLSLSKGTLCLSCDNTQVLGCRLLQHQCLSNAPQTSLTSGLPVTNLDHIISNGCHFRIVKYELCRYKKIAKHVVILLWSIQNARSCKYTDVFLLFLIV